VRLHGLPLLEARRADRRRLREAAARRDPRRPDALHPRRRGGARLGGPDPAVERLGAHAARRLPQLPGRPVRPRAARQVPRARREALENALTPTSRRRGYAYVGITVAAAAIACAGFVAGYPTVIYDSWGYQYLSEILRTKGLFAWPTDLRTYGY